MKLDPEKLAAGVCDAIQTITKPLLERIKELESRCTELEARPAALAYKGIYQHNTTYRRGESVTHRGSLWIAVSDTTAQPGLSTEDSRAWVLAVKAGRDGRDARRDDDRS